MPFDFLDIEDPDDIALSFLASVGFAPPISADTKALEAQGWRPMLQTLFSWIASEDFSEDHVKYWDVFWSVLLRLRQQQKWYNLGTLPDDEDLRQEFFKQQGCHVEQREFVLLLILGRGMAKSSTMEMAGVLRGCMLGPGYMLYVCESQDQANEHVQSCKELITHEESRVVEFYPHMEIDANARLNGRRITDRQDLFMTVGGWIARAKGLDAKLRGLRIGGHRPDYIVIDDVDSVNDSIDVSIKKHRQITTSVIPTQARRWTQISMGQNLVVESGVVNMLYTGKSDALNERITIGVSNTFETFVEGKDYVSWFDEKDSRVKHTITPEAKPTWAGVDRTAAQKFLNDSGLEAFKAEYMNDFSHLRALRVFYEFNEERHLITWDMYQAKYGKRYIAPTWQSKATVDLGYSKESISAWLFGATAPQNQPLPGRYFMYRSLSYELVSIDDQAIDIWAHLFPDPERGRNHFEASQTWSRYPDLFRALMNRPEAKRFLDTYQYNPTKNAFDTKPPKLKPDATDEEKQVFYVEEAMKSFRSQVRIWRMSHEKTGEQWVLAQKYGLPIAKVKEFGKTDGAAEGNQLLHGDYTQPHPFKPDEKVLDANGEWTGTYRLGSPYMYFIVEQIAAPRDDRDMLTLRDHLANQVMTQEKLTELGFSQTVPQKYKSDHGDALRMFCSKFEMPSSEPLTVQEKFLAKVEEINPDLIITSKDEYISPERQMEIDAVHAQASEKLLRELGLIDEDEEEDEDGY